MQVCQHPRVARLAPRSGVWQPGTVTDRPTAIRRIVPDFQSDDPQGSAAFYVDVLGLELGMDLGWIATYVSGANETAQVTLMRAEATAPVVPDASVQVDDVAAVHARAVEGGFEIVHPLTDEPWGVRRFFVREPNGKVVNVMQHLDPTP